MTGTTAAPVVDREPAVTRDQIEAHIRGDISGQVAFGSGNVQVGSVHGGVVNIVAGAAPTPALRPAPVRRGFRVPSHPLLGRDGELDRVLSSLRDWRPVAVSGEPGIGKTTLLSHVASHPELPVGDRVVYKRARRVPAADVLQLLFDTFYDCDVRFKPTEGQLRDHLASVEAVVLLDDVDLERDDVEELLGSAPECRFVVASSERRLLGAATALALGGLPEDAAAALVERELGRPLGGDERAPVLALHRAVGGHPLRILQAASLVRDEGASFADLAAEASGPPSATAAPMAVPPSVGATLGRAQRDVLGVLSAHGGAPVHVDTVIDLTGRQDAPVVLQNLLDRHLVQAHSPRYSLTMPLTAGERESIGVDAWSDRVVDHWCTWAAAHGRRPDRLADELEPVLGALDRATEKGRWHDALRLIRAVDPAVVLSGAWAQWKSLLATALTAARRAADRGGEAWALHQLGVRALCLGQEAEAQSLFRQALSIRRTLGDTAGAEVTRYHLDLLRPRPPLAPPRGRPGWLFLLGGLLLLLVLGGAVVVPSTSRWLGGDRNDGGAGRGGGGLVIDVEPRRLVFERANDVRTVRVRNAGDRPVDVSDLTIGGDAQGDFAVAGETCTSTSLDSLASCTVLVRFGSAATEGSARLLIDNSAGQPASVDLAALPLGPGTTTTTVQPPPAGAIAADPPALRFGTLAVGRSAATRPVTIRAAARGAEARIARVTVAGASPGDFEVVDGCAGKVLGPATACTVDVGFSPVADGFRSAILVVTPEGGSAPLSVALEGTGAVPSRPRLVSATADKGTGMVTYDFDADLVAGPVDTGGFHIYTGPGAQISPTSAVAEGRQVQAAFAPADVVRSTVATVEEGAVADVGGRRNLLADAPLHDVVGVAGRTSAPDLVAVRSQVPGAPVEVLLFDFDQPVQVNVGPADRFEVVDAANRVYESAAVVSAGQTTVGATFTGLDSRTLVRGIVEAGAVTAVDATRAANPFQSVAMGPPGEADRTTDANLIRAEAVRPNVVRFTFDQALVPAPTPLVASSFRVFGPDAVEQDGLSLAAPAGGSPAAVDVTFPSSGPVPVDRAVGASVTVGGTPVPAFAPLLLPATEFVPATAAFSPSKASRPLRAQSFPAGRTALPDLVGVVRSSDGEAVLVLFVFDEALPADVRSSATTLLTLALYDAGGQRTVATGSVDVVDSGRTVVVREGNVGGRAALSRAVEGSVDDPSDAGPRVPEGHAPLT